MCFFWKLIGVWSKYLIIIIKCASWRSKFKNLTQVKCWTNVEKFLNSKTKIAQCTTDKRWPMQDHGVHQSFCQKKKQFSLWEKSLPKSNWFFFVVKISFLVLQHCYQKSSSNYQTIVLSKEIIHCLTIFSIDLWTKMELSTSTIYFALVGIFFYEADDFDRHDWSFSIL